jgi:hypothetical protein
MNFDWRRWKTWDFVVMAVFVLTIIGVSLTWWSYDTGGGLGSAEDMMGAALEEMGMSLEDVEALGLDMDQLLEEYAAEASADVGWDTGVDGWKFNSLVFVFLFSLIGLLWVVLKAFFPINRPLPNWYREGLGIMILGGLMTFISFLRLVVPPEGGHSMWNPGAGAFITLIVSVVMLVAGFLMWKDKSGVYGSSTLPKIPITTHTSGQQPPAGTAFCVNCGAPLVPGEPACRNCGKPV